MTHRGYNVSIVEAKTNFFTGLCDVVMLAKYSSIGIPYTGMSFSLYKTYYIESRAPDEMNSVDK